MGINIYINLMYTGIFSRFNSIVEETANSLIYKGRQVRVLVYGSDSFFRHSVHQTSHEVTQRAAAVSITLIIHRWWQMCEFDRSVDYTLPYTEISITYRAHSCMSLHVVHICIPFAVGNYQHPFLILPFFDRHGHLCSIHFWFHI